MKRSNFEFVPLASPPILSDGAQAVISEALVPCIVWPDVPVLREIRHELTIIQRFILEAGLKLQTFEERDITEITSIPEHVVRRFLPPLVRDGALAGDDRTFHARPDAARVTLERAFTSERKGEKLTFLFFPRTDDLIACPDDDDLRRMLRISPACSAPLPAKLCGPDWGRKEATRDFLAQRVLDRTVVGLPSDIVAVAPEAELPPLRKKCGAWRAMAEVRVGAGRTSLRINFYGADSKKPDRQLGVTVELQGADRLAQSWIHVAEALSDAEVHPQVSKAFHFARGNTAPVRRLAPSRWAIGLNAENAEIASREGDCLVNTLGVAIQAPECSAEIEVTFEPTDSQAARRFAIDLAVVQLRKAPPTDLGAVREALRRACKVQGLSDAEAEQIPTEAVLQRLWDLGDFGLLYTLRQASDFHYESVL